MNEQTVAKFSELFAACAVKGDFVGLRKEATAQQLIKQAVDPYHVALSSLVGAAGGGLTGYFGTEDDKKKKRNALYGALTGGTLGAGVPLVLGGFSQADKALNSPEVKNSPSKVRETGEQPAQSKDNKSNGRGTAFTTPRTHGDSRFSWYPEFLKRLGISDDVAGATNMASGPALEAAGVDLEGNSPAAKVYRTNPNNITGTTAGAGAGGLFGLIGNQLLGSSRASRADRALLNNLAVKPGKNVGTNYSGPKELKPVGDLLAQLGVRNTRQNPLSDWVRNLVSSDRWTAVNPARTIAPARPANPGAAPELTAKPPAPWDKPKTPMSQMTPSQRAAVTNAWNKFQQRTQEFATAQAQHYKDLAGWSDKDIAYRDQTVANRGADTAAATRALRKATGQSWRSRLREPDLIALARTINANAGREVVTVEQLRQAQLANRRGQLGAGVPGRRLGKTRAAAGVGLGSIIGALGADPALAEDALTWLYGSGDKSK